MPVLIAAELADWLWLVPLGWLAWRRWRGAHYATLWWYAAGACAISWLADTIAQSLPAPSRWLVSAIYPALQVSVIGLGLLQRAQWPALLVGGLALVVTAVLIEQPPRPDLLVHLIAWAGITVLAWRTPIGLRLQVVLLTLFTGSALLWLWLATSLTLLAWSCYQGIGALGIALFCWGARPLPRLALAHE